MFMETISKYKLFFIRLQFNFERDFEAIDLHFEQHDKQISAKLKGKTYLYTSPNQTKTSFYFFDSVDLTEDEQKIIHLRVWNQNKTSLYFVPDFSNEQIGVYYSFTHPKRERILISNFSISEDDEILLRRISKHHFDTGAFWLNYQQELRQIQQRKKSTVDRELISTLRNLKSKLEREYQKIITEKSCRDETIQALIDRTLFIKFLEDRQIINTYFYQYFFGNEYLNYKYLLKNCDKERINLLFSKINAIFNNILFNEPKIPLPHLTSNVLQLIHDTIAGTNLTTGQLALFDYQFDIIPIEFISHIYEIFLEHEQEKGGIYFTPKGLAELIIDNTIDKVGTVVDPSCGSGIFLIVAFRKLIEKSGENPEKTALEKLNSRNKLLVDNVFGIEKQRIAQRLAIFSLYLELLNGIAPDEIKKIIKKNINTANFSLFPETFANNIINANSLEVEEGRKPLENKKFDFIIGNPPWKPIKTTDEEIEFLKIHKDNVDNNEISQCFLIKIEEWGKENSQFGFVVKSSNFYNQSKRFQTYFFNTYNLKKFYDFSKIPNLFLSAKEAASIVIFSNTIQKSNEIQFFSPEENDFAKIFDVILLKEEDSISIPQEDLKSQKRTLRDYLVGNEGDLALIDRLQGGQYIQLNEFLLIEENDNRFIHNGLQLIQYKKICREFGIDNWNKLTKEEQDLYKDRFKQKYTRTTPDSSFKIPYIEPRHISKFQLTFPECYLEEDAVLKYKDTFERTRGEANYTGEKILCPRIVGKELRAIYFSDQIYFSFDIYVLKLQNKEFYHLILPILNSKLVDYYLLIRERKRIRGSYPKITMDGLKNIPIPKFLNSDVVNQLVLLSKKLTAGNLEYDVVEDELDRCIFDLYGLSIAERNRIKDFYIGERERVNAQDIVEYCTIFYKVLKNFLQKGRDISFEFFIEPALGIPFAGIKISFPQSIPHTSFDSPSIKQVVTYLWAEFIERMDNRNILSLKERIYSQNSIYIVKDTYRRNWSQTKALEDAQAEIERLCN